MASDPRTESHAVISTAATDRGQGRSPGERLVRGLTGFTGRYRWAILGVWIVLVAVAAPIATTLPSVLSGGGWDVDGSQSRQAADLLATSGMAGRGRNTVVLVVHDRQHTAKDPAFADRVGQVVHDVVTDPTLRVGSVYGWSTLDVGARGQFLGADQRTVSDSVALGLDDAVATRQLPRVQDCLTGEFGPQGLDVALVSAASMWGEVFAIVQSDVVRAELVTLPLIAIILLLLFRSVVAVVVCLSVGISSIAFTLAVFTPIAHHLQLSVFMENTVTMLGLGIGVDYSLFIISRFQEELRHTTDVPAAVATALQRSGHTVVFSGSTVMAAMSTLFLIRLNAIMSLTLGAVTVVGFSVLIATLLLPALLQLLGTRINKGRPPFLPSRSEVRETTGRAGPWHRFAMTVMRHPVALGALGVIVLVSLAIPAFGLRTFTPDARILPNSSPTRQGFETLQQQFGVGATSPVQVVVTAPQGFSDPKAAAGLVQLDEKLAPLRRVAGTQSVVDVLRTVPGADPAALLQSGAWRQLPASVVASVGHFLSADGHVAVIELQSRNAASADATRALVNQARRVVTTIPAPLRAVVGGETAAGMDSNAVIAHHLPAAILVMLSVVFLLLLVTFRSLVLPIKGVLMNLLSLGATESAVAGRDLRRPGPGFPARRAVLGAGPRPHRLPAKHRSGPASGVVVQLEHRLRSVLDRARARVLPAQRRQHSGRRPSRRGDRAADLGRRGAHGGGVRGLRSERDGTDPAARAGRRPRDPDRRDHRAAGSRPGRDAAAGPVELVAREPRAGQHHPIGRDHLIVRSLSEPAGSR